MSVLVGRPDRLCENGPSPVPPAAVQFWMIGAPLVFQQVPLALMASPPSVSMVAPISADVAVMFPSVVDDSVGTLAPEAVVNDASGE